MTSERFDARPPSMPWEPLPLRDPRKDLNRVLFWIIIVMLIAVVASAILGITTSSSVAWGVVVLVAGVYFPLALFLYMNLPRRDPDILYLRSFVSDKNAGRVRRALEAAAGDRIRIAGIRAPSRRLSIFDRLSLTSFVFRYGDSRYLDLEAGLDWLRQLWATLHSIRGVVIDLCSMTPGVFQELRLCAVTLPLNRVLFIVDDSRSFEDWQADISLLLGSGRAVLETPAIAVCDIDNRDSMVAFKECVRNFVTGLPSTFPSIDVATMPSVAGDYVGGAELHGASAWAAYLAITILIIPLINFAFRGLSAVVMIVTLIAAVWYGTIYIRHLATWKRRVRALVSLSLPAFVFWTFWVAAIQVHEARHRSDELNSLKQLGLAIVNYPTVNYAFPPACRVDMSQYGSAQSLEQVSVTEQHSWVVTLLPYLDQGSLYNQIRLDRPLTAPENQFLREIQLPAFEKYLGPSDKWPWIGMGGVGKDAPLLPVTDVRAGLFGYGRTTRERDVTDGMSSTIAILLSQENPGPAFVGGPSTVRGIDQNRRPYIGKGAQFGRGTGSVGRGTGSVPVLFADGTARFVSESIAPTAFEAMATIAGGEVVVDRAAN